MSDPHFRAPQARDFALAFQIAEREHLLGNHKAALGVYRIALSQWPDYPQGWVDLSRTLFALRRWPEAWEAFGRRFEAHEGARVPARAVRAGLRDTPRLRPGGKPKRLAALSEGGLGDTILFSRFVAPMMAAGVDVRLIAPRRLIPLLRTLDPCPALVADDASGAGAGCDAWAPMIDLPALLRLPEAELSAAKPTLRAEPARIERWRAWLAERRIDNRGPLLAIAWRGSPDNRAAAERRLPLADFAALAAIPGATLVCLQQDATNEEIRACGFHERILRPGPGFDEDGAFLDSAALLILVDRLVSVDTALVHLAGALARPGDILLGRDPDWRWLAMASENVWHPHMRVWRRGASESGADLVARCAATLAGAPAALACVA